MTDPGATAPADQVDGLLADAFLLLRGIRALRSDASGVRVTKVRCRASASRQGRGSRQGRRPRPEARPPGPDRSGQKILNFGPCYTIAIDISLN